MSEWIEKPLSQLVTFQKGRKVDTSSFCKDGYSAYLGASGIEGREDGYGDPRFGVIAKQSDTLMLWDGERSGLVGFGRHGVVASTVSKLSPNESVDPQYLYFSLLAQFDWIQHRRTGTGVPHVPKDLGRILKVSFPKRKTEQAKIASILSTIDTAIEQSEALIEKYQHIKAGLMHDLFTRGVLPNGQLRPPREHAPELYQETAIGWIPREWKIGQIGNHFEIQLGKMLNQLAKTGKNSFPYLGNRSVQWNRLDMDHLDSMDFSLEERKKFALKEGDLLVCEGGEVGRTAIWESQMENCFYQKAIHRLRIKHESIKPRFMLWYMHFAQANGQFADFTSQSSIAHLTQEKLAKVPLLLPSAEEQALIVSRIDAHESVMQGQRDYRFNLSAQKLGLMQDLLTGKVPVTVDVTPSGAAA